jgi:phosphoribosylanthranilate isomerase
MTWVKICGITNLEDALVAVDAGADAVGFVFYEKSPRFVSVEAAREIIAQLPVSVEKVGVFVSNANVKFGIEFVDVGLTATQSYLLATESARQDDTGQTKAFGRGAFPTLKKSFVAFPAECFSLESATKLVASFEDLRGADNGHLGMVDGFFDTLLLDSGGLRQPGGTGETFDWEKARAVLAILQQGGLKAIVAGGLKPENVSEAIRVLHPWGVDVASGVEARPGKKDSEKVRAFVRAVREHDAKVSS